MDNDVDQALVDRYRKGDREAFTELVIRYQRPIYNAAFWILRSADDASEIGTVLTRCDIALDVLLNIEKVFDVWSRRIRTGPGKERENDDEWTDPAGQNWTDGHRVVTSIHNERLSCGISSSGTSRQ